MSYIEGENLEKLYGKGEAAVAAVRHMSVAIESGEFVALMGESGSGKSTLLSILGALNTPTAGQLRVNGVDVYALSQDKRADFRRASVGFVFQNFNLIPYLTLAENVMLPLATERTRKRRKRAMAEEALSQVGLSGKFMRLPGQISGGEQERVAIARAIVNKPPILLADEPTGNLDTRTGKEIMGLLSELNKGGVTVIMVTHSTDYSQYAHRVLKISDGTLVQ
jgi:putative ABC transport system ATP-binding protein